MAKEKKIGDDDFYDHLFGEITDSEESEFDEQAYLLANPDVAEAIVRGEFPGALYHYRLHGAKEGRPRKASLPPPAKQAVNVPCNIEAVVLSTTGALFVIGWVDDRTSSIESLGIGLGGRIVRIADEQVVRCRRRDVEQALGFEGNRHFGFIAFLPKAFEPRDAMGFGGQCAIYIRFNEGGAARAQVSARIVADAVLRDILLGYFAALEFCGNKEVESFYALDNRLGDAIIEHNGAMTRSIVAGSSCQRFGPARSGLKGSIIVCLYGRAEYQFLQNALFSAANADAEHEFIYVSNSPELLETLHKTAAISERIYGISQLVVALPGNAGFGAANNVAAGYASTGRLLIVNPDVFPVDQAWALRHAELLDARPKDETRIFSSRLFYSDGSMMHAGMYLETDWGVSIDGYTVRRRPMLRVEHYGKGAPASASEFRGVRPVPAVSGAFISVERSWFERLGGFTEDYVFGHYEDADLCLRSLDEGAAPWVHNLPLWHLEGKGSTRQPHHEGASQVNRWLFTRTWHQKLEASGMLGRAPALPGKAPEIKAVAIKPVAAGLAKAPARLKRIFAAAAVKAAR